MLMVLMEGETNFLHKSQYIIISVFKPVEIKKKKDLKKKKLKPKKNIFLDYLNSLL